MVKCTWECHSTHYLHGTDAVTCCLCVTGVVIVDIRSDTPFVGVNVLELTVSGQGVTPGDIATWIIAGNDCNDVAPENIVARAVVSEDLTLRMPLFTQLDGPVVMCYRFDRDNAVLVDAATFTKVSGAGSCLWFTADFSPSLECSWCFLY